MNSITLSTLALLVTTCIISFQAFSSPSLLHKLLYYPYRISRNQEWWRFISGGFIHNDWMHLLGNMVGLYFFGPNVENVFWIWLHNPIYGSLVYILFYLTAILAASLPRYQHYRDSPSYSALGASGAVSAIIVASAFIRPDIGIGIFPFNLVSQNGIPGFIFAPLYLWYSSYMSKKQYDNVAHDAHYFGAIYGIIIMTIIDPQSVTRFTEYVLTWIVELL